MKSSEHLIEIVDGPLDCAALLSHVSRTDCGATVLFTGSARQFTGDQETLWLEYESYDPMARRELGLICDEVCELFDCRQVAVAHRTGRVNPGETSIAIAVASPHRAAAFDGAKWMMDAIKSRVPVWKKDFANDGTAKWVSPGMKPVTVNPGSSV